MFLKCKLEDAAWVTSALSCHYGSTVADRDSLRPLVRFISMATLKSSDTVTTQVISRQHKFLNSICTVFIQNLQPVESLIQVPNSNQTTTIAKMILSITDNINKRIFHAAVPVVTEKTKSFWHPLPTTEPRLGQCRAMS